MLIGLLILVAVTFILLCVIVIGKQCMDFYDFLKELHREELYNLYGEESEHLE